MSLSVEVLKEQLAARQRSRPQYSLRAFARDLGVHPGTLSSVLQGKRRLPLAHAERIAAQLRLSPRLKLRFIEDLQQTRGRRPDIAIDDSYANAVEVQQNHYQIIAEWEHTAVLGLFHTEGFTTDPAWIAKRLGISTMRVDLVLDRLVKAGLLRVTEDGGIEKTADSFKTSEDIESSALRQAHTEELKTAVEKLETIPTELRDYSSITLPVDINKLPQAKLAIQRLLKEMDALFEGDRPTEVYQLCVQLFPLTQLAPENEQQ